MKTIIRSAALAVILVLAVGSIATAAERPSGSITAQTCDYPHWQVAMKNPTDHRITFRVEWTKAGVTTIQRFAVRAESRRVELFVQRDTDRRMVGSLWRGDRRLDQAVGGCL